MLPLEEYIWVNNYKKSVGNTLEINVNKKIENDYNLIFNNLRDKKNN